MPQSKGEDSGSREMVSTLGFGFINTDVLESLAFDESLNWKVVEIKYLKLPNLAILTIVSIKGNSRNVGL
ncbi:uncharacterized protein RAG0_13700 [Rhynchosporium agropyri]|uniref:Uncharacterized protein n=1 Tax=Rhynchosporium agropyri TaxID=914238 RepID=A0A1E1LDQ7_9HELO|nr:uncharacterized protein RAG0_13700 [Rhynchosporium agropyri]